MIKYDVEELFPTPLIKIKVEENTEQLNLISDCTTSSIDSNGQFLGNMRVLAVSYTHLTLPTTSFV